MNGLEHRSLAGMDISTGGHAKAALQAGGKVGDDVAEHIVGHDYIELPRIADHLGTEGIHVHVLRCDLRILTADFLEHSLPQSSRVGHGIRFVAQEDAFARGAVPLLVAFAIFEGVADDSLNAFAGVDVFLHRDLIRRTLLEDATRVDVDPFGVFAHDYEIQVLGLDSFQRAERRIQQPNRAHVGVQVHLEAHAQKDFPGVDVRGHSRIAECAEKDGVEIAFQHGKAVGRDGDAVRQVAIGAPVKMGQLDVGARSLDDVYGLSNDLGADTVPGDNSDSLLLAHGLEDYQVEPRLSFHELDGGRASCPVIRARWTMTGGTPVLHLLRYNQSNGK